MKSTKSSLAKRLKKIRCLLLDVDGVLTDGKIHFTGDGKEFKSFDVQDGHGIAMAQRVGFTIGFISGRPSEATTRRAEDLGVKIVMQKPANKMAMVEEVKAQHSFTNEEIAFVGDELVDLPVLRRVGLAIAVPNAVPEVKKIAHYITRREGGAGAVREVIELLLKAQGKWAPAIAKYLAMAFVAGGLIMNLRADDAVKPEATGYIEKFEVPERDEDGNLKWKVMGEKAQVGLDGQLKLFNMRAEFYQSNSVAMTFSAPACTLDQLNKKATTDTPVKIEGLHMIVTGDGADWVAESNSFTIRSNVHVIISQPIKESK